MKWDNNKKENNRWAESRPSTNSQKEKKDLKRTFLIKIEWWIIFDFSIDGHPI